MNVNDHTFLDLCFAGCNWCFDNLRVAFESEGIEWNEENITQFINSGAIRTFEERETEVGWEILKTLVWDTFR